MIDERRKGLDERHIGFTGTRDGMTPEQAEGLRRIMQSLAGWLHHGDCVGADAEAHVLARSMGMGVVIHPPTQTTLRAFCEGDEVHEPMDYLVRDRAIVDASDALIAAPKSMFEEQRSGTWATVRYARRMGKPVVIVWPDGNVKNERNG